MDDHINRRALLWGAASLTLACALPTLPAALPTGPIGPSGPPSKPLLSFIVGSDGASDWQWFKAFDKADAIAQFVGEHCGADACEVDPNNPPDDCDCEYCDFLNCHGVNADRVKRWDDRTHKNPPTAADWLKAGYAYRCACGIENLELGDGTFICDDGTVECEWCHARHSTRITARQASVTEGDQRA